MPGPELKPFARVVCCLDSKQLPVAVLGASPSFVRVFEDNREDGRRFLSYQGFSGEVYPQSFQ